MLSAIAARKAAQATQGSSSGQSTSQIAPGRKGSSSQPSPVLSPSPPSPPRPAKPNSKRKNSDSQQTPRKKKKKRGVAEKEKTNRYFISGSSGSGGGTNGFERQDDVIALPPDESSDSELEVDFDELEGVHDVSPLPDFSRVAMPSSGGAMPPTPRAYSPSRPAYDSSEDEDVHQNGPVASFSKSRNVFVAPVETPLSTYRPILDGNTFRLTPEESQAMGLSPSSASILALEPTDTVTFIGSYRFTVLSGVIRICGVLLRASSRPYEVFAPKCSPLPVIEHAADGPVCVPLPSRIGDRRSCFVAVQALATGVEGLGRVCRTFNGVFKPPQARLSDNAEEQDILDLPSVHLVRDPGPTSQPFLCPHPWTGVISAIAEIPQESQMLGSAIPKILIRGHKKTGKSTLARTVMNNLLQRYRRIAFLELDLGQSEFTPPGLVALNVVSSPVFGPPFTHPQQPLSAHFIGSTSASASPAHYLSAVEALLGTYESDVRYALSDLEESSSGKQYDEGDERILDVVPLVINTMGWTKGLGAVLSCKIEELVQPTDILDVSAPSHTDDTWGLTSGPESSNPELVSNARLHTIPPIHSSVLSARFTAADHRTISILSYFFHRPPSSSPSKSSSSPSQIWDVSLPLCAVAPYEVDCSAALGAVILSLPGGEDVVPAEIGGVLNGAIVGLVTCPSDALDTGVNTTHGSHSGQLGTSIPYIQGCAPPAPSHSRCVGLALVRSLSVTPPAVAVGSDSEPVLMGGGKTILHMLTPTPPALLHSARVLVKGELEIPVWGLLDYRDAEGGSVAGTERGSVPFLQWDRGVGVGSERRRVRRNLMRKGQM